MKLQIMELGEPDESGRRKPVPVEGKFETIKLDSVISAIGQYANVEGLDGVEMNKRGIVAADEATYRTNLPDVFAVGDATNRGASIAIEAIGEGQRAAAVIDSYLAGAEVPYSMPFVSKKNPDDMDFSEWEKASRAKVPHRAADERRTDFQEVNKGFDPDDAVKEALRCLECGCHDYGECDLIRFAQQIEDLNPDRLAGEKHKCFKEDRLASIERDQGKCILCGLCVRVCDEEVGAGILGLVDRGFETVIKPEFNDLASIEICQTCKKCAEVCPTGALRIK